MKNNSVNPNISEWQMVLTIEEILVKLLKNIPLLSDIVVHKQVDVPYDIEISAAMEGMGTVWIVCEVKGKGEPQYIRRAVDKLAEWKKIREENSNSNFYCMIAAPYISSASAKLCEELGVGYLDLSGNCLLRWQGIYIRIEGNPNQYKDSRGGKAIFERSAVKSSSILRVLLQFPQKGWRVQELADAASSSLGQISKVKRFLEEREYVISSEAGFILQKQQELVMEWGKVYNSKPNTVYECYTLDSVPQMEQRMIDMKEKIGVEYTLTAHAAAVRYAPAVRYNKVHVYIPLQDLKRAMEFLRCKIAASGSNLSIIVPYDPGVLLGRQNIKGIDVVSTVQACLDLLGLKGRGEEAAQAVLDKEYGGIS